MMIATCRGTEALSGTETVELGNIGFTTGTLG